MTKHVLLTLCLIFTSSIFALAQDNIPNHSFEEWEAVPVNWVNPLLFAGIDNVVQSTDAQSGNFSARFFAAWSDNTNEYVPASLNSLVIPVTEQHTTLNGYYKGSGVGGDILSITVAFYADGFVTGTGYLVIEESATEWTAFSLTINNIGDTPTEALIYIIAGDEMGNAHEGTEFLVDNLTWDGTSSIVDLQGVTNLTLSPNPANNHLQVDFTMEDSDQLIMDIISSNGTVQTLNEQTIIPAGHNSLQINTSRLSPGIYMLRARGEKSGFVKKFLVQR